MNIFKKEALNYFHKGIDVLPDGFMTKRFPAGSSGWSTFYDRPASKDDLLSWFQKHPKTNISTIFTEYNDLCVIDVDTTDQELLKFLEKALPQSPVERIGSKGFVRFYRKYPGICNYVVKDGNKQVIFEVLAKRAKVTIPPSIHPAGMEYVWKDKGLLDVEREELPILPPMLIANMEMRLRSEFPDHFKEPEITKNKTGGNFTLVTGRTNDLKKLAFTLIERMDKENLSIGQAVEDLINYDLKEHESNPLFKDTHEQGHCHTHVRTNAMKFLVKMLDYVQGRRFKDNKMYITLNNGSFCSQEEHDLYELGLQYKKVKSGSIKKVKKARISYDFE